MDSRKPGAKSQFAKILVERDDEAIFTLSTVENLDIIAAWRISPYPGDVMPARLQRIHGCAWKIFIR
jgi:hypothetical protein